ncbi:MAG: hypothetical protein ABIE74_11505 [Pseudomonadota bacterium]
MMGNKPLAIFAALSNELSLLKGRMLIDKRIRLNRTTIFSGQIKNSSVILVQTGVGKDSMYEAVHTALNHFAIPLAINLGFCGGASPELFAGDVIIPYDIFEEEGESTHRPQKELVEKAQALCKCVGIQIKEAKLLTCDKAILSPHDKAFVASKFQAHAIDMESSAFLKATSKNKIPSFVVRAVLDPLDMEIPALTGTLDEAGDIDYPGLIGEMVSNPKLIFKLPKFNYLSTKARENLTTFIVGWIEKETSLGK